MPPKFADLTKSVTDLFNDDFGYGATKLVLKSKASNGTTFKLEGLKSAKGNVDGTLETKLTHSGFSVKEKWSTSNDVLSEVSFDSKVLPGSKITAEVLFNANKGLDNLRFKVKGDYEKDNLNASLSVNSVGVVSTSAVFGVGKYLLGAATDYDTSKSIVGSTKISISYVESDVIATSSITNGSEVEGSIFHVPNSRVSAGVKFSWNQSNATSFELAGKYKISDVATAKAKINKDLNLGLSYTHVLSPGVNLTLAALVKGGDLQNDAHQLGLALSLEQ